jgi:hypothetical protein
MRTSGPNEFNYSFRDMCTLCFAKYMRTSGPNEFNYCRAFDIFVSIALLNI